MTASDLVLDHIVIAASSLAVGRDYVHQRIGIDVPPGGQHQHMGTHNRLMRLSGRTYLEIIAIDPTLDVPNRPRWFGLDDPETQARLLERPRLLAWVAGSTDLDATVAAYPALGTVADMRRGAFKWRMAVRDDGALLHGGAVPICLQWPDGVHPADGMEDRGFRLERLDISDPDPGAVCDELVAIGASSLAHVIHAPTPSLSAVLETSTGEKITLD